MPSRKRLKGRARKASKPTAALPLMIKPRVPAASKCNHGLFPIMEKGGDLHQFYSMFFDKWQNENFLQSALAGVMQTYRAVPGVWNDEASRQTQRDMLLKAGANIILGVYGTSPEHTMLEAGGGVAMAIFMLENFCAGQVNNFFSLRNHDTFHGDERRLVGFFARRITGCDCLSEWFERVKRKPKTGICCNCKDRKVITEHFVCSRCERYQYCSKACQEEDWARHKRFCKRLAQQEFRFDVEARGLK